MYLNFAGIPKNGKESKVKKKRSRSHISFLDEDQSVSIANIIRSQNNENNEKVKDDST